MDLLTPAALGALILLPALILLHLRRRRYRVEEVSSLLVWREVLGDRVHGGRRLARPEKPLLLLQVAAVATLILSLARPASPAPPFRQLIVVLDDSLRMAATDLRPNRLAAAKELIDQQLARLPAGALVTLIAATARPFLVISSTDLDQVRRALDALQPTGAPADFSTALRLAGGWLQPDAASGPPILLLRAPDEVTPPVTPPGLLETRTVGIGSDNQALLRLAVRCSGSPRPACTAFAAVRNEDSRPATVPLVIRDDLAVLAEQPVHLPPRSDTGLSFPVPASAHLVEAYLADADILPQDNAAWSVVPVSAPLRVTLVGTPERLAPLIHAFTALGGVRLQSYAPGRFPTAGAAGTDLLILDGWSPPGGLPATPAMLLIDPPSLPDGRVMGVLPDATISGMADGSPLLQDLDLAALDIPGDVARQVVLPPGVSPVVWSAGGSLLAAGQDGPQQLAVLSFDPLRSDLVHLNAFPVLLRNILRWAGEWLPPAAAVGDSVSITPPPGTSQVTISRNDLNGSAVPLATLDLTRATPLSLPTGQPGGYGIGERGSWGSRQGWLAVNIAAPDLAQPGAPIALSPARPPAAEPSSPQGDRSWWPWIGAVVAALLAAEWLYVWRRAER